MKKHPSIPDFLIIGAGKSGTTSLNNYLRQHDQIFIPSRKEPNFYGYELKTKKDFEGKKELLNYNLSITKLDGYLALFDAAKDHQVTGETSNSYLYHEDAPERIKYYNPDVKLIAILRQPAERLYSRYLHLARVNRLPTRKFEDCLDRSTVWWTRNDLIPEGFYYKNLSRYYQLFPESQIKVFLYDEFNASSEEVLEEIFHFLGVDPTYKPEQTVRYNPSGFIKNKNLDKIIGPTGFIQTSVKSVLNVQFYRALKENLIIQSFINRLRKHNLNRPQLNPEIREILTREIYGPDIDRLGDLIKKDLSSWRTATA